MERTDESTEATHLADIAAEATNEGSPAQSVPENIPPRARAGAQDKEREASRNKRKSDASG